MDSQIILDSFMPKDFPLDKFELVKIEKNLNESWSPESQKMYPHRLSYYFEEKNIIPDWYKEWEFLSKWFTEYKTISDLPLRNNFFEIKVRTRRWLIKATNKVFSNELKVIDKWTRNTKDLSFF